MCRYAFSGPYKIHFTCFECRKAFKQPSLEDWMKLQGYGFALKQLWRAASYPPGRREVLETQFGVTLVELESRYHEAAFKCPECKQPMANLGRDFKAPRRSDIRAWKAIQKVYRLGHAFQTCGCDGPGFIPASELEYQGLSETDARDLPESCKKLFSKPPYQLRGQKGGYQVLANASCRNQICDENANRLTA